MRGFTLWLVVWIAFVVQAFVVQYLPLPPWGKLLTACVYGGAIGWGVTRWKHR